MKVAIPGKSLLIGATCLIMLLSLPVFVPATNTGAQATGLIPPQPISVATRGVDNITMNSATLLGELLSMGNYPSVQVAFEWGTTTGYGHQTPFMTPNGVGPFSVTITGLDPGTTYNFRAIAVAGTGTAPAYGANMSFTTHQFQQVSVQTDGATMVNQASFMLHGNLVSKGSYSEVYLWFDWGTTAAYGNSTPRQRFTDAAGPFTASISGLAPGTTYHFRAAAAGTAIGAQPSYGADMSFTTPAANPMVVKTQAASNVTASAATLNGYLASAGVYGTVNVFFQWGISQSYGQSTQPLERGVGQFSAEISGLATGVTYHFRAVASAPVAGGATVYGENMTFTTSALTVRTNTATVVSDTSAILNGTIESLGGATSVNIFFEYGETTAYGSTTPARTTYSPGAFSAPISGLRPGATYHFRAVGSAGTMPPVYGTDVTFVTSTGTISVTTGPTYGVTSTTATLTGNLNTLGSYASVEVWFEWGADTFLRQSTARQLLTTPGPYNTTIYGLTSGLTYYYRAVARAPLAGAPTAYGMVNIFTTAPPQTVSVVTEPAEGISSTSATINGMLVSLGSARSAQVWFEYGTSAPYQYSIQAGTMNTTGNFYVNLSGLQPNTTYYYRAAASAPPGGMAFYGEQMSFTTAAQQFTAVSTLDPGEITANSARINGYLGSLGQYSQVQVWFAWGPSLGYGNFTTPMTLNAPGAFSTIISGLKPGITYHYRAAVRAGDNLTYGSDEAFNTPVGAQPRVSTEPVSKVLGNSATLNGQLISLGDWQTVYVWFEWGHGTGYGNKTPPKIMNSPGAFDSEITGLESGTTYHYRAVVSGIGSGATTVNGSDIAFSTAPQPPKPALSVTTGPASNLTSNSVVVSGGIPSLGDLKSVQVYFEWGVSSAYGNATPPQTLNQAGVFTATITGLSPGTTYHYRAVVIGPAGPLHGSNATFTTPQEPTFGLFSCARR